MPELRAALSSAGYEDVATYVQSGNVVLRGSGKADDVAAALEKEIADAFGLSVAVIVRTPAQLRRVAESNPFLSDEDDYRKLHVVFCDAKPTAKASRTLDPDRAPPNRFSLRGREIYLHLPDGAARSKLTLDYFERRLGVKGTARNWRTVNEVVKLTR